MERKLPFVWSVLSLLCFATVAFAQTTVFSDDFSTSAGTTYSTSAGPIGTSSKWSLTRSGTDFGAKIDAGILTLTNDAGGTANASGWVLAGANTASFAPSYISVLSANPGVVTWSFNMRQLAANPSGFGTAGKGVAFVLAGTAGTTNVSGTGYAVILGNNGSMDPVRLVRYTSGLRTYTNMISSNTSGLTDFGNHHLSVKVTYTPSSNTWQLFVRKDGTSGFQDPASGTLASQGTVVNNSYTLTALPLTGCFWNLTYTSGNPSNQTAFFDNVAVTVAMPSITSISPGSRVAGTGGFTLTVNGANFVSGTSTIRWNGTNRTTTYISPTQLTASISAADVASSGTASITVGNGTAVSNAQTFTIDPADLPTLTVSTNALASFSAVSGVASPATTYSISGANLTSDPVVTPPANFEVSLNGSTYFNNLTLTRTGNVLTGQPVTIYARVKAVAPAGIIAGSIDHSVASGASKQVSVMATVLATQPSAQANSVTFTNVTSTSFTANWNNGNGSRRLVVIRAGSAVNSSPVDGVIYTAALTGWGSEIGTGNFVVYSGAGNSATITGLSAATTYHLAIYEFNGSGGTENYLTTGPATGNRATLNAPIGWQIYTTNTVNTIDFDTTVDGVNADVFQADGILPNFEPGTLNSNAWAIAGFSDGSIPFGGSYTEETDFDRGPAEAGVEEGGLYAFETSPSNFSLGIQPAAGDFAPGSLTLRFQNQTGGTVNSINVGYKVYVYNDTPSSSNFAFSHSANNSVYTPVAGLDVVSTAAPDLVQGWKAYYRVVTLTGLNIANNNYYYLRWSGATVLGAGEYDEFALDDIVMVANPTSTFVPIGGAVESVALLGNAVLSEDMTLNGPVTFNGGRLDAGNRTLTLNATVINTTSGGLRTNASSHIVVGGSVSPILSFDQTVAGTTNVVNSLHVNTTAGNTVGIANPVVVNQNLTIATGQSLNLGTNALAGTLNTINNNGTILTQNATSLPLPSGKIWGGNGTVHYNAATAAQTVVAGTYQNLTASSTGGATASGTLLVNRILHLPSNNPSATTGSLSMGAFSLIMGESATNSGPGDVTGIITRTAITSNTLYTFGHAHTSILFPAIGTLPTSMSLKVAIGNAPSWRPGAIRRTYDFIQTGGSGTKAIIKSHYLDSELNGNNEFRLVDWAHIVSSGTTLEQGRSNFNTTDNYIELTNVNVGLYFTPTFGEVLLTLDESEAASLTWNGSVSDSWTTAANWTPNATPSDNTIVHIPNSSTTPNDPTLNPIGLVGSVNIEPGGILNAGPGSQLTVNNGPGAWLNNGTFNPGTSTIVFTNPDATIAGTTNFNNVAINSGASLRPVTGNVMRIAGQLVNNGSLLTGAIDNVVEYSGTNQTIAVPGGALAAYHNLVINGTGAIFPDTLNVAGDFVLNQSTDFTGKTIVMSGLELQTIGGAINPSFENLTINNTFGEVVLAHDLWVNGTLTMALGNLNIGNNTLTLANNAVAGLFGATRMIVVGSAGEVRRTFSSAGQYLFPIGEKTGMMQYSPITVEVISGTFSSAFVGVSVVDTIHPNNASVENNISRYWRVNQQGITDAVVGISAKYSAVDLTGPENRISAAQLSGAFNQQTNPWVKHATLAGNTLSVASAVLPAGQTSVFTGIKGQIFTAALTGYGSFCQGQPVTLAASAQGGDLPYTYAWSGGLGTQSTATPPTGTVGMITYTVTVKDNNGIAATDSNNVVVVSQSVGGTALGSQFLCAGTHPANLTLSGYNGSVVHWQSSLEPGFGNLVNISNTSGVLTGEEIGNVFETTYFRAVVANGSCGEVFSSAAVVTVESTTWDGVSWSNGEPNAATEAIFEGDYTAGGDLAACSITVNGGAVVIPSGFDVNLNGALVVAGGSFTLNNNANLLQATNAANSGNIVVKRNSSAIRRLDYTLWSSPVAGQNLLAFSPATVINRFYQYNSQTNLYNALASPSGTAFAPAKGYLIRVANNHPAFPWIWNGKFTGEPHNGDYSFAMFNGGDTLGFNLVGNPYPSPIKAQSFVDENASSITQTLYFWRETNGDTQNNAYCTWAPSGDPQGLGTFVPNSQAAVVDPQGIIQTGQGFFVEALEGGTQVSFNNQMRTGNNTNQFFRQGAIAGSAPDYESHRIWLNLTNAEGAFCQTAFGYMTGATQGHDLGYDARYVNTGATELYSIVEGGKYVIQGRALPFVTSDIVPLGFKAGVAGTYAISIDHIDGLFGGSQDIFLKDYLTGAHHDLKAGAYTFTSDSGLFNERFEVVYQGALGAGGAEFDQSQVVIYKRDGGFLVDAGTATIDNIKVFDIRGRLVLEKKAVNASQATFNAGEANQVLIVKIKSKEGREVTRKAMN